MQGKEQTVQEARGAEIIRIQGLIFAVIEAVIAVIIAYAIITSFGVSDPIWVIVLATAISTAVSFVSPLSPGVV